MITYRILKNSETKLVVQAVILADGTIRAGATKLPVVLAGECARLGLDPKKVQAAAAPVECLAKLGQNPGGIEVIAEDDYQAARTAAALAAKTPAEKDWDATVIPAIIAQDRAESASYEDPARICSARKAAARAREQWATRWPAESAAKSARACAEREAHDAEIRSRPGYIAALEGRD